METPHARVLCSLGFALTLVAAAPAQQTFLERAKLTETVTGGGTSFGRSVATSGDIVVVGEPQQDFPSFDQGAAYVFAKPASGWDSMTQLAVLSASDGARQDEFGYAVAIQGDTIVVGARHWKLTGAGGAAYVFEKPAGGWVDMTETVKLAPCCAGGGYNFGASVAIDGDTIVVGASQERQFGNSRTGPGGAHVFEKPAGASWQQAVEVARLAGSDVQHGGMFSVATIDGDTILIGAPHASMGTAGLHGAVYVFEKPSSGWVTAFETAILVGSDSQLGRFGASLNVDGDTLVVGAPSKPVHGFGNAGAAYVFDRGAGGWPATSEVAKLTASNPAWGHLLGTSVSIEGDLIAAGATGVDAGGQQSAGATFVFERPASGWTSTSQTVRLTVPGLPRFAGLGRAVSIEGGAIFSGAWSGFPDDGAVFVLEEPTVTPNSGCGGNPVGLAGATRIGRTLTMTAMPCAQGAHEFALGAALAAPLSLPPALSCSGASTCLLSCNPLIRIPGQQLVIPWATDPSFVGISLCVQGLCLDPAQPCLDLSDMVTITITS